MNITKDITIEELTEDLTASVKYLMTEGIRCIVCGEPIWGTLDEAAKEKGFSDEDVKRFVRELQELADNNNGNDDSNSTPKIEIKKL